jgi:isopenicillin N synthase-like dioxygenase
VETPKKGFIFDGQLRFKYILKLQHREMGQVETDHERIPTSASRFIVNIGDCLERMTNGRLLFTPHRVVIRPGGAQVQRGLLQV